MLRCLIDALGDALAVRVGAPARSCGPDELSLLTALTERASAENLAAMIERCLQAEVQLDRYVQLSLVVEGLLDSLVHGLRDEALALRP